MGKLKDNYNKAKPTQRQVKKNRQKEITDSNNAAMCSFLEKKWNNTVHFSCEHCLKEAYDSELNNTQGYVTDEELIESSNNKLKHK